MKTAILLLLLLLCASAVKADLYDVGEESVYTPPIPPGYPGYGNPPLEILYWGVSGPTAAGDVAALIDVGFFSLPGEGMFGSLGLPVGGDNGQIWEYAGGFTGSGIPVGYTLNAVVNIPNLNDPSDATITYSSDSTVAPEPGTLLLLGSGLVGLGLLLRRASRSQGRPSQWKV